MDAKVCSPIFFSCLTPTSPPSLTLSYTTGGQSPANYARDQTSASIPQHLRDDSILPQQFKIDVLTQTNLYFEQPQRPLRPTRVQGDENIAPAAHNQALHQRHKSTGTLMKPSGISSNMLSIGGLKAAAKRTAFGDVSNTAKTLNTSRDDSVLPAKPTDYIKPLNIVDKSAGFLRPAQRPLNAAAVKVPPPQSTQGTSIESTSNAMALKAPLGQLQPAAAGIKRTVAKKGTVIYKDDVENEPVTGGAALPEFVSVSTAPVHKYLQPVKLEHQTKTEQPVLRRTESKIIIEAPEPTILDSPNDELINTNQAYEEYKEAVELAQEPVAQVSQVSEATQEAFERLHRQLPTLPAMPAPPMVSEPEEYWEEEDDEDEIYDEQGYTTAHSYRSRGDNTTGGVTTVLFPKVTNKSKKELADAQVLVESGRTTEDIEDELFDVSMVAEYNEDIFAYMRELEVRSQPRPLHFRDTYHGPCGGLLCRSPLGSLFTCDLLFVYLCINAY